MGLHFVNQLWIWLSGFILATIKTLPQSSDDDDDENDDDDHVDADDDDGDAKFKNQRETPEILKFQKI